MEKIVETRICKHCRANFDITDKDLEFYEKISPIFPLSQPFPPREKGVEKNIPLDWGGIKGGVLNLWNGKVKYLIPAPILCPDCRQQRRLSFRNERKLYKRKCDFSRKDIISMYSPDKPFKVYEQNIWWSDKWDALNYGPEDGIDFSKSFFEQFNELMKKVPKISLITMEQENSDYSNFSAWNKDSYLIFTSAKNESIFYSNRAWNSNHSMDCSSIENCNHSYQLIDCKNCNNSSFLINCFDYSNCHSSDNLIWCENCFLCNNLSNVNFCIKNIKYCEQDYFNELKKAHNKNFHKGLIQKYINGSFLEKYTWNSLFSSKNVHYCFEWNNLHDCKYVFNATNITVSYDLNNDDNSELVYESIGSETNYKHIFNDICWINKNISYCNLCFNSSYLFGCSWLRNKSYCILNKQYTKEEYEKLVPKIIEHMQKNGEWWEFFLSIVSPFGYNETVAQEYFPLSRDEVIFSNNVISNESERSFGELNNELSKKNVISKEKIPPLQSEWQTTFLHWDFFNWSDYEAPFPKVEKIIPASKLPQDIKEIPDDILNWAIECEITKKPFRIIPQELEFYRKHNLPIPKRHPDQRHLDRMKLRNPRKLFTRKCDKCRKEIQTTYAPERPEIVYCQECYEKEIY